MSASAEDANAAERFLGLLQALAKEPSAKRLMDIAKQNDTLRRENKSLHDAFLGTNLTIHKLNTDLKSAEDRFNKTDSERKAAINASEGLSKQLKVVQERLETEGKKWDGVNEELERFREYVVTLDQSPVQDRMKPLNDIYTAARSLVQDHFGTDLPSDLLREFLWDDVRLHNPNTVQIPLLMSNTPAARQMRVAAVLAALASELCKNIFQPTYLLEDPTGLNKVLDKLVTDDSEHEAYLRAALLCASEYTRPEGAAAAIKAVVDRVSALVEKLLAEARRDLFRRELKDLCTDACTKWQDVQRLHGRAAPEPGTSQQAKFRYQWKPLFDPPLLRAPAAPTKQRASTPATAPAPAASPKLPVAAADNTAPPDHLAEGIVVWPAFYSKLDDETLAEGFVLPGPLIRVAAEEQRRSMMSPPTPVSPRSSQVHRDTRDQVRNSKGGSRRHSVANKNGQADVEGSRNGSGSRSFLSVSSGGGGKGT